jgi:hypothetical protein
MNQVMLNTLCSSFYFNYLLLIKVVVLLFITEHHVIHITLILKLLFKHLYVHPIMLILLYHITNKIAS